MSALPAETMAANGTEFVSWRHCDVHTRSTFNILSLCLSTLVICVWNAVHPDVPDPKDSRLEVYLSRFGGFLLGLFLPEMLVLSALDQFLRARKFLREMNGAQSEPLFTCSYWKKLLKEMYPRALTKSYWTEAWRNDVSNETTQPQWTMTQSFYAVMGGYHARYLTYDIDFLTSSAIKAICEADMRKWAFFTETAIQDHSKAGVLSKALFCWQLLVFAISCIARRAEHLPLSLLEITTLAHSLCGLATFALWWRKPHSANEVIVVPIEEFQEEWGRLWAGGGFSMRGLNILLKVKGKDLPMAVLSSLAVAALYGLPHLLGMSTEFPTSAERHCWQVATAIIIGTPMFTVAVTWVISGDGDDFNSPVMTAADRLLTGASVVYCIASCFIVAESFRQLFALPSGAFVAPALVCYLPHFS